MPSVREHLTFKGGTSLSKAWKFIERFSEDIDIIVDKVALGFGGDAAPDRAPSNKQRRERLEKLMEASRQWVQGTLQPALDARLRETLGDAGWRLEVDPDLADGQCLLFHYPALFTATTAGYVRPVVKIELGARSDDWPHETKVIQPYVIEFFPAFDPDATFSVNVLAAETYLLGKRPASFTRRHFALPTNRESTAAGPSLLRPLVPPPGRGRRASHRRHGAFSPSCRASGNLFSTRLGGLLDP